MNRCVRGLAGLSLGASGLGRPQYCCKYNYKSPDTGTAGLRIGLLQLQRERRSSLVFAVTRTLRLLIVAALATAVAACTFTKFAYNQADTVMVWLADDHFDLDTQQKAEFQKRFDRFHQWHRFEQLPDYAQFMKVARTRMQDGVSQEDVMWFVDGLKGRTRTAAQKAAPEAAPLLATLTPAQIENLQ